MPAKNKKAAAAKKNVATKKPAAPSKKAATKTPVTTSATSVPAPITGTRYFAEKGPATNSNAKWTAANDNSYYNSPYYTQHQKAVQAFHPSRTPAFMDLNSVLPVGVVNRIKGSGQISFHMNGDTGGSTQSKYNNEVSVVDMMTADLAQANGPSFFFHLGDVVYNFGEEDYYYDQFYDPFRTYDAPIFAIPGNHDGMIFNATMKSLDAFMANFCTVQPQTAPNAGGLIRSTMNQPGVYFTLDAPFVSIIGLYSNVIDGGPGVISTQGNKFPVITDVQLAFLNSELTRLKAKRLTDPRAIIVAVHHPPFSGDAKHGGSPLMSRDLDKAFTDAGMWPDAVISGHAHHYERFQRSVNGKNIPYIIAGSGGYNNTPMPNAPNKFPAPIPQNAQLSLVNYLPDYGYLTVTVNAAKKQMTITFNSTNTAIGTKGRNADSVVVPWG